MIPWREAGAEILIIGLDKNGELDYKELEERLKERKGWNGMKIGSFSACSNITGVRVDTEYVSYLLHTYGFLAFFDFAAGAPYLPV